MAVLFQCFDTIEQAYSHLETLEGEDPLLFVHEGTYVQEFLLIDMNISIIGAGKTLSDLCDLGFVVKHWWQKGYLCMVSMLYEKGSQRGHCISYTGHTCLVW